MLIKFKKKNCSQPITKRKTRKSEIETKRSGVNSRDSITEVFYSLRERKKKKINKSKRGGKEFLRREKTLGLSSPPQRDERAKLRVLTRCKTRYIMVNEKRKTGTARGKKLYYNLIKLLQLASWS